MSAAIKIAKWVQKKPMILIRFDEAFSESLHNSRQGFEHLTMAKAALRPPGYQTADALLAGNSRRRRNQVLPGHCHPQNGSEHF